jgi:hypothetical protein
VPPFMLRELETMREVLANVYREMSKVAGL